MGDGDSGGVGRGGGVWVCGGVGFTRIDDSRPADQTEAEPSPHLHRIKILFRFSLFETGIRTCASPKSGKILSLSHIRMTRAGCKMIQSRKRAFYKMFLSFFVFVLFFLRLFLCYGVKVGGEKCLLSRQPFHTMNPSPLCKYKMRNRIMHVFPKICFL